VKRGGVLALAAGLGLLALWLQRESAGGTFDAVERGLVSWLAANAGGPPPLPPMTLVLYDEESSELSGADRMEVLDGALFARAAAKLGAVAVGVEGLPGDPRRMIEAAGAIPVFGGYDWQDPPGTGWTPLPGDPRETWPEVPGLAGRGGRFARGFLAPPRSVGRSGEVAVVGRNGGRTVASFLALAWASAGGVRVASITAQDDGLRGGGRVLPVGAAGTARFWPGAATQVITLNELLVMAESFERQGGAATLEGRVVVLARATPEVARVERGGQVVTPVELWAVAWEAVRTNRLFVLPGWWATVGWALLGCLMAFGPASRTARGALLGGFFALLVYGLAALALFQESRLLLPAGPVVIMLVVALLAGRWGRRAGWFGSKAS